MIRIILIGVFLFVYLILSIPVIAVLMLLKKAFPKAVDMASLRIVGFGFRCIESLSGARVHVEGMENIPKDEPVLYIGNHESYFDVILTYSRVPGLTSYISKPAIFKIPVLGTWMKMLYCLSIDRENPRKGLETIMEAMELIKKGISVCIYPEGTRSKDGTVGQFHGGSFKIAEKTGCKVIPVSICGSRDIWENHIPFIRAADVRLIYGAPIDPKEFSRKELKKLPEMTRNEIIRMIG